MLSFINRHFWIVILLVGGIVLLIQRTERAQLTTKLADAAKSKSTRSTRTSRTNLHFNLPSNNELLKHYQESTEIDGASSLLALTQILSSASSPDLVQLLDHLPEDPSYQDLRDNLNHLLQLFDPIRALKRETDISRQIGIFTTLARQSPTKASAWLAKQEANDLTIVFKMRLNEGLLLTDPSRYTDSWEALALDPPFLSPETFDSVAAAINSPEQSQNRDLMIQSLLLSASIADPQLACTYATDLKLTNHEIRFAMSTIALYEMGTEPLLNWALTLPNPKVANLPPILENFMASFAARDLPKADKWLTNLKAPADAKDILIRSHAYFLQQIDPAKAMPWLDKIQDPEQRTQLRSEFLHNWKASNPTTAAAWQKNR